VRNLNEYWNYSRSNEQKGVRWTNIAQKYEFWAIKKDLPESSDRSLQEFEGELLIVLISSYCTLRATGFDEVCRLLLPMATTRHQYFVTDLSPLSVNSNLVEALLLQTLSSWRKQRSPLGNCIPSPYLLVENNGTSFFHSFISSGTSEDFNFLHFSKFTC
jgi:hypothetical protein